MNAIILAAGYATRLYPLTRDRAKPLLPVAERPLVDWLRDKIDDVEDVRSVHVVTNSKFAPEFERWAEGKSVVVHDDGTTSDDDKRGAIGDVQFVVERAGLDGDDLLVIAGDNLFDYSLADYVAWWRTKGPGSAVALYDVRDRELVKQYGIVALDGDERIVSFVEKPDDPPTTLAATATYIYHREHVPQVQTYLAQGNSPDQPGNFIAWLHRRQPVYGYRFAGEWLDIGDREQLLAADNRWRRRVGLPERAEYTPD